MRIALLIDAYLPRINGVVISVHSYATELAKLGHTVCIFCPTYTKEQIKKASYDETCDAKADFTVLRLPSSFMLWSKEDRAARLDKWFFFKTQLDAFSPDVIHINTEGNVGLYGRLYAQFRSIPYVYTMHTLWEEYVANYAILLPRFCSRSIARSIERTFLKHASLVIVPTKHIEAVASRYGVTCPIELLPTGIPDIMKTYDPHREQDLSAALRSDFPKIYNKKVLLFVGRMAKEKNIIFLFHMIEKLHKTNPDTVLLLVGGGPEMQNLKKTAKEMHIDQYTFFTGYITNSDMVYFYRLACVFVFPSKTETQGLVTLESMMAGTPVVAIGEMGTIDVMQGDHGGFMVSDDVDLFTGKVKLLLDNEDIRKSKSEEGKKWCRKWAIEELSLILIRYYESAVEFAHCVQKRDITCC